ncbi:hypothetical protein SLA2020_454930 [Shorea laevis]
MDRKFGARQPTGTPSLAWSCLVVIVSLLAGASVVHNIYKPNLTLSTVENADAAKKNQADNKLPISLNVRDCLQQDSNISR